MTYLILVGAAIIFELVRRAFKKEKHSDIDVLVDLVDIKSEENNENNDSKTPDSPVGFGYKTMWIAVKTDNQPKIATLLGMKDATSSNWKNGIERAYKNSIFITPTIDGWTLAVGWGLPSGDSEISLIEIKKILKKLSVEFSEAHFFSTHRVVDFHCWIKSTNGNIDRLYSYLGESGENIEISGSPTEFEKNYKFINMFSEESKRDDYFDRQDLTYPDEELVMKIANNWSIDPTTLENRTEIKKLGLVGKRK